MIPDTGKAGSVIIASEPFTENKSDWMRVERNSMMIVDENLNISFKTTELNFNNLFDVKNKTNNLVCCSSHFSELIMIQD